jgi:phenylacetate-CoA ligase
MGGLQGRDTDIILTPSGNRLIAHYFTGILEHYSEIDTFQIVQEKIDSILLRILPAKRLTTKSLDAIVLDLKSRGAGDLHIETEIVESIPLPPSGKRRFIISKLAQASKPER